MSSTVSDDIAHSHRSLMLKSWLSEACRVIASFNNLIAESSKPGTLSGWNDDVARTGIRVYRLSMHEKDQAVVDVLEVRGDKYLPFADLHQELLESALTTGEIDDALQQLGGASLTATDVDDLLIEDATAGKMAGDRHDYFGNDEELD